MPRPLSVIEIRIVRMDGDVDFGAVAGQRFVDGVVQYFEHQVMQARAVGSIADVHAGALAHRFQAFEYLDAVRIVGCVHAIAISRRH